MLILLSFLRREKQQQRRGVDTKLCFQERYIILFVSPFIGLLFFEKGIKLGTILSILSPAAYTTVLSYSINVSESFNSNT